MLVRPAPTEASAALYAALNIAYFRVTMSLEKPTPHMKKLDGIGKSSRLQPSVWFRVLVVQKRTFSHSQGQISPVCRSMPTAVYRVARPVRSDIATIRSSAFRE
jgi:hypothetical protein